MNNLKTTKPAELPIKNPDEFGWDNENIYI